MLTETQIQKLKPQIQKTLQNVYSGMEIVDIVLRPDEDFDGDPILRVYINYKGEIPYTGSQRAVSLDKIRDILEESEDSSFPVMTFIKEKNTRKRGRIA